MSVNNQPSLYGKNKSYLSYSAIDLWLKSREEYRKIYYQQRPKVVTPELAFGKKIAELLENADESVAHIKQYQKPEHKLSVTIEGVHFFGFVDSYDPDTFSFYEFKTGKTPWTQKRVDNHLQLDLYSLAIKEQEGKVTDQCKLIWLETKKVEKPNNGLISHEASYGIELTGQVMEFDRVITDDVRDAAKTLLVRVAKEIEKDYKDYQLTKIPLKSGLF